MTVHQDSGLRCLVFHGDGGGQCIKCTCGVMVRPKEWQAHLELMEQRREAEKTLEAKVFVETQRWLAEKAVIEAAVEWHSVEFRAYHMQVMQDADDKLYAAVAALRKLEGEV